jgi:acyl-CoA reductase-like NAD-dependent aldehyde dehydrogenase
MTQSCVAVDYVFVPRSRLAEFTQAMKKTLHNWYGTNPQQSKDYGRIVNERHFDRLLSMLHERQTGQVILGGEFDRASRYIAPTVVADVDFFDAKLMGDEIFGPILPVVTYTDIEETMGLISKQ